MFIKELCYNLIGSDGLKRLISILLLAFLLLSCAVQTKLEDTSVTSQKNKEVVKEKSIPELVSGIHDLDTEFTVAYNNFDSDYTKFSDSASSAHTLEALKTVQLYADRSKTSGKKALESFNTLFAKINEIRKKTLDSNQKDYIDKLDLANTNYKQVVVTDLEHVDKRLKYTEYVVHNELFFEYYKDMLRSLIKLPALDNGQNWKALNDELLTMNNSLNSASKEVSLMKEAIAFKYISEYDKFVPLMQEHIDKTAAIVAKKQAGKYVSQEEINEADNPGLKALAIFTADQEGTFWAEGEEDELETYRRDKLNSLTDKAEEYLNKADAYYDDAKLRYEQLIKQQA